MVDYTYVFLYFIYIFTVNTFTDKLKCIQDAKVKNRYLNKKNDSSFVS